MGRPSMSDEMIPQVAERFRALAEPARLQLLLALTGRGERTVNALVQETGLGQANVSKHLQLLHALGFLRRRKSGLFVHYSLADRQVVRICELMFARASNGHASNGMQPHGGTGISP
jgi:DNA-binding transcriptional ArsR family regulator